MGRTPATDDSDESLMLHIQGGNHQAFSILARRHADRFYAACFRMCGNRAVAEDMVQEAFLKLWSRPGMWRDDRNAKFTTWFYRILVNQNIDRLRRGRHVASDDAALDFVADNGPDPERLYALTQEQQSVERALAQLPERQRTALTLCFYEGLSNADAAQAMGVKIKALESLLMRAKAGLRGVLSRTEEQDAPYNRRGENHAQTR